ncbi:MAG: family 43 glycosylhydrolase [Devosia sp.]|nr:family 43 glycosylhydrolase [Devosia sp.]
MSQPIFADPILDGAADPTVIQRHGTDERWMFYTNRRAKLGGADFGWIHGSPIGVAVSNDGGRTWTYRGTVAGLDDPVDPGLNTHWAPEVIWGLGEYHMYLTYISGTPTGFEQTERWIIHFTSPDLESWTRRGPVPRPSPNMIDAAVAYCPDGKWRLWYKDEAGGSSTWSLTSDNLYDWSPEGRVIPGKPEGNPHEGPNVLELGGWFWLIVDEWRGQAVYRSTDARHWSRQGLILDRPGSDPDDRRFARHADVVVQGDWAALFYFTHPHWAETETPAPLTAEERRTVIHVARLWVEDGVLKADRDVDGVSLDARLAD